MGSTQISDPVDPLSDFSAISFFPRTFNRFSVDSNPDSQCDDLLETAGVCLKSMALKSPNRLLEQAKSVLDGGMENLNVENLGSTRDEDMIGDLVGKHQKNTQGRRPGLGRKKARFTLKPNSSQSVQWLKPDVNKYPDPEEYFSAVERHENAIKELKRQRGTALMDLDQNVPSVAERRRSRRPGLPRKPVSYKHLYPAAPTGDDKILLSSQETFSQDICSPSNGCSQTENLDHNPLPSTGGLSGPVDTTKERPNDISDSMQSGQDVDEDDESDEILEMLQQRFKPIELKETCLTDLPEVHRSTSKAFGDTLQDSQDKMSHLHDIVSAIGKETTLGRDNMERSSDNHRSLLPAPRSPYASISSLRARLFQSRQAGDPFSALDIDSSPLERPYCHEDANDLAAGLLEKSDIDSLKMARISAANLRHEDLGHAATKDDGRERNESSPAPENVTSDCAMHVELNTEIVDDDTSHQNTDTTHDYESNTVHIKDTHLDAENPVPSQETLKDSSVTADIEMDSVASDIELGHDILASKMRGTVPVDNPSEALNDADTTTDGHMELDDRDKEGDAQGHSIEKSNWSNHAVENLEESRPSSDHDEQSTAGAIGGHDQGGPSSSQAQPFEEPGKASSQKAKPKRKRGKEPSRAHAADLPVAGRSKAIRRTTQSREGRETSRRKSLSACGTQWQSGIRRSTRIRTRPLEYWKGERPLYGRIHESLVTVIGTKMFSPTKENGQGCLRVKSYVADEYKEVVELAALH